MLEIASLSNQTPGIADRMNAARQSLVRLVTQSQFEVAQKQAIVTALQAKAAQFSQYLADADVDRQAALAKLDAGKDALRSADSLAVNMKTANAKCAAASGGATAVSADMATLVGKLILAVEFINKVGQLVNKQKSNNPLVPDKLVENMRSAGTAANQAVALTLSALQSCYVAEATLFESREVVSLGARQSRDLEARMRNGWDPQSGKVSFPAGSSAGLVDGAGVGVVALLQQAHDDAQARYEAALASTDIVTRQLAHAQSQLDEAVIMLGSYQSGLAAADTLIAQG